MERLRCTVSGACGLLLSAALAGAGEEPNEAKKIFTSLFEEDVQRVNGTPAPSDDVKLAGRLLEKARSLKQKNFPELLAVFCEKAYTLGRRDPSGYQTAIAAMELLADQVPGKAEAALEKVRRLQRRMFNNRSPGERKEIGRSLIETMRRLVNLKLEKNEITAALEHARKALQVAAAIDVPEQKELRARIDELANQSTARRRVEELKAKLEANPLDDASRRELLRLLVVNLDAPKRAKRFLDPLVDDRFHRLVPLAARDPEELGERAAMKLAQWYRQLAKRPDEPPRAAMLGRAKTYYQRYLELHEEEDLSRFRATLALDKIKSKLSGAAPSASLVREKTGTPLTPKSDGWIDLISRVDLAADTISGEWSRETSTLTTKTQGLDLVRLPVQASGSYHLRLGFVYTSGDGSLAVHFPVAGRPLMCFVSPTTIGIAPLAWETRRDENRTFAAMRRLEDGREHQIDIYSTVTQNKARILVSLDGVPELYWSGTPSELGPDWSGAGPPFGLGAYSSTIRFGEVRVRPTGDRITELTEPPPEKKPVDVLSLVKPETDARKGSWARSEAGLRVQSAHFAKLALPVEPHGSYELTTSFVRQAGSKAINFMLPVGPTSVVLQLGAGEGGVSGLSLVDESPLEKNPTAVQQPPIGNNQLHTLRVRTRIGDEKAKITTQLDGEPHVGWSGPVSALKPKRLWKLPNEDRIGLGADQSDVTFRSIAVRMLRGKLRRVRGTQKTAEEAPQQTKEQWVDLLKKVDADANVPLGKGGRRGNRVGLTPGQSGGVASFVVPAEITGSYDLRLAFKKAAIGKKPDFLVVVLPVGSSEVALRISGAEGGYSGLQSVGGEPYDENPTSVQTGGLADGRKHVLEVKVRVRGDQARIVAGLNQRFLKWEGPVDDLKYAGAVSYETDRLAVGLIEAKAFFHHLQLRRVTTKPSGG